MEHPLENGKGKGKGCTSFRENKKTVRKVCVTGQFADAGFWQVNRCLTIIRTDKNIKANLNVKVDAL